MNSNARVKSNAGIAHAAVAKPESIVHRAPEPRPCGLYCFVCTRLGCCSMEGLAVAAKWLIGGVECGVD